MPNHDRVYRPLHEHDATVNRQIREVVERSREILNAPIPDTFLGRKTQEPSPQEE